MDRCRGTLPDPGVDDFGDHLYRYLEEHIQNKVRERGEFQLTSALDRLRREQGFLGLLVDGVRYDIGVPEHYVETVSKFRER